MSLICGMPILECVYCLGCARWAWQRAFYSAGHESEDWGLASAQEFKPVPRLCRYILAIYENDLKNPIWAPPGGYRIDPDLIMLKKDHSSTEGRCPPYIIYLDHENADVVLAIRGLNLGIESDYAVLFDNKLGQTKFHGGYVHNGLLKAANWVFESECDLLRRLLEENPGYKLTFAGHSLGAGVVALLTIVAVQNLEMLGISERKRVRCYAMAPARCMSLNLAVRYADVINSIVLQDDFLPRTTAALEDVYKSILCLPCLLCIICLKDTCTLEPLEENMIKDPRRLYAPGRIYHIVERKPCSIGRFPPAVRTAIPVDGRFEHVVISCNVTADHAIVWIERESQKALDIMVERDDGMGIPNKQRMERQEEDVAREHDEALRKAYVLKVPSISPRPTTYGTFNHPPSPTTSSRSVVGDVGSSSTSSLRTKQSWSDLFSRITDTHKSG